MRQGSINSNGQSSQVPWGVMSSSLPLPKGLSYHSVIQRPEQMLGSEKQWESTKQKFRRLADQWHQETDHLSVTMRVLNSPAYKDILLMGADVILPLIFDDLRQRSGHWFEALELITKENPARDAQTYDEAVSRWLEWAECHEFGRTAQAAH